EDAGAAARRTTRCLRLHVRAPVHSPSPRRPDRASIPGAARSGERPPVTGLGTGSGHSAAHCDRCLTGLAAIVRSTAWETGFDMRSAPEPLKWAPLGRIAGLVVPCGHRVVSRSSK